MIRFVRTATVAPGQFQSALAFAKEISAVVESKLGVTVNVFLQAGGIYGRICWQIDYDDMGAFESAMGQVLADPDYLQKVDSAGDLFIGGQTRDSLWSQI